VDSKDRADLQGISLSQLANMAAAGDKEVTGVVSRKVLSRESPSGVPAMMFTSALGEPLDVGPDKPVRPEGNEPM
jgi:hypothetical protein